MFPVRAAMRAFLPVLWRHPRFGRLGHERLDPDPLLVGQVSWIPLGLACNVGHPATVLSGPHPKLESQPPKPPQPFSNGLLDIAC